MFSVSILSRDLYEPEEEDDNFNNNNHEEETTRVCK